MNIFVIDLSNNTRIGTIDFKPSKEDRIILNEKEFVVTCVVYYPQQNGIMVYVYPVVTYYIDMINNTKWG